MSCRQIRARAPVWWSFRRAANFNARAAAIGAFRMTTGGAEKYSRYRQEMSPLDVLKNMARDLFAPFYGERLHTYDARAAADHDQSPAFLALRFYPWLLEPFRYRIEPARSYCLARRKYCILSGRKPRQYAFQGYRTFSCPAMRAGSGLYGANSSTLGCSRIATTDNHAGCTFSRHWHARPIAAFSRNFFRKAAAALVPFAAHRPHL